MGRMYLDGGFGGGDGSLTGVDGFVDVGGSVFVGSTTEVDDLDEWKVEDCFVHPRQRMDCTAIPARIMTRTAQAIARGCGHRRDSGVNPYLVLKSEY